MVSYGGITIVGYCSPVRTALLKGGRLRFDRACKFLLYFMYVIPCFASHVAYRAPMISAFILAALSQSDTRLHCKATDTGLACSD